MNILGSRYKETAASSFALFRLFQVTDHSSIICTILWCFQALAAATTLFYAGAFGIQWQLLIVVTFLFFATLAFLVVLFDDGTNEVPTSSTAQQNNNKDVPIETSTAWNGRLTRSFPSLYSCKIHSVKPLQEIQSKIQTFSPAVIATRLFFFIWNA
jgi:hypothetical protein